MLNPIKTLERKLLASTNSIDNAVRRTLGLPETVRADSLRGRRVLNALKVLEEEAKNNGQFNMKKLYKQASDELNKALLKKLAGGYSDSVGATFIPSTLANIALGSGIMRAVAGASGEPSKEEISGYDKNPVGGFFTAPYRDIRRRREILARAGKAAGSHVAAEEIAAPGLVLGALLGGGAAISRDARETEARKAMYDAQELASREGRDYWKAGEAAYNGMMDSVSGGRLAAEVGAGSLGVAAIAAELAAPIVAAITPTRTAEEQLKHDKGSAWKSWLIPGVASYNRWKRLGRIIAEDAERTAPQKKTASAVAPTNEELKKFASAIIKRADEHPPVKYQSTSVVKVPPSVASPTGAYAYRGRIVEPVISPEGKIKLINGEIPNNNLEGYYNQLNARGDQMTAAAELRARLAGVDTKAKTVTAPVKPAAPELTPEYRARSNNYKRPGEHRLLPIDAAEQKKIRLREAWEKAGKMAKLFKTRSPFNLFSKLPTEGEVQRKFYDNYVQGGEENARAFDEKKALAPIDQHKRRVNWINPGELRDPSKIDAVNEANVINRATMSSRRTPNAPYRRNDIG